MKKLVYNSLIALSPVMSFAQQSPDTSALDDMVAFIGRTISALIPIMFGLAIIFFFWGLIQFLRAAGDPKAKETGRNHMIWGIIAIAVMLSIYGLADWLRNLFGIEATTSVDLPTVEGLPN
mgnify:CR=1 FL=1